MVKKVRNFNRAVSERDKLLQQISSREISKARKELNRKISGNSSKDKMKSQKLISHKHGKHMSEWLKRELHKKKIEDAKNSNLKRREYIEKERGNLERIKSEPKNEVHEIKKLNSGKKNLKKMRPKPTRNFPEPKKEVPKIKQESKLKESGFFQRTVSELKDSFDFSKKKQEDKKISEKNFFEEKKIKEPKQKVKISQTPEDEESKEGEEPKEREAQENGDKTRREEISKSQELKETNVRYLKEVEDMKTEVAKAVVGQDKLVIDLLRAIFADGHILIEGVPGVAKTLLIRAIAESVGCKFSRIQFTVDLLPTDITGITTYTPGKGFETIKGPIFTNFVIADEINRAPPKTQSALLEAMQERQVTIGKNTFKLSPPFFVMANNNPIESSGTYKLPEAQIDRFLFKLNMGYPTPEQEQKIIDTNITLHKFEDFKIKKVLSPQKIIELQKKTKEIQASPQIKKYIVDLIQATRKPKENDLKLGKYIEWGGSPRASIALYIGAKADAIMRGQNSITPQNVKNVAHIALRHRILLNYSGQAENINTDHIIDEILSKIQVP